MEFSDSVFALRTRNFPRFGRRNRNYCIGFSDSTFASSPCHFQRIWRGDRNYCIEFSDSIFAAGQQWRLEVISLRQWCFSRTTIQLYAALVYVFVSTCRPCRTGGMAFCTRGGHGSQQKRLGSEEDSPAHPHRYLQGSMVRGLGRREGNSYEPRAIRTNRRQFVRIGGNSYESRAIRTN